MLDAKQRDLLAEGVERTQVPALHRALDAAWRAGYSAGRAMTDDEIARRFVRLVLVAHVEDRAEDADWEIARRLANEHEWPEPPTDPWLGGSAVAFYWPEGDPAPDEEEAR